MDKTTLAFWLPVLENEEFWHSYLLICWLPVICHKEHISYFEHLLLFLSTTITML